MKVPRHNCPSCKAPMIRWSGYFRFVSAAGAVAKPIWIARAKCKPCACSHALLPLFLLVRRFYPAALIGSALFEIYKGAGMRVVGGRLGVPHTTCRDWWRRFRARAPTLAAGFCALAVELGGDVPKLSADPPGAALEALAAVYSRAKHRFAEPIVGLWELFSAVTGGQGLSTTTGPPYASGS